MIPESVRRLTAAFYDWELQGRGWQIAPFPVRLEPCFAPFVGHFLNEPCIDDGRRPTWLGRLIEWSRKKKKPIHEDGNPNFEQAPADEINWEEYDVFVPPEVRANENVSQSWLNSLRACHYPFIFELRGTRGASLHFVCEANDAALVCAQTRAFFPGVSLQEARSDIQSTWNQSQCESFAAVDFGLAREFMIPLRTEWDGLDPITSLLGALAHINSKNLGLVQILIEPAQCPWAESIQRAVTTPNGQPFFADAPEITTLAKAKTSSPLFAVVVRVVGKGEEPWEILRQLGSGFGVLGSPRGNELVPLSSDDEGITETDVLLRRTRRSGMIWSAAELASLVHPPDRSVQIPGLIRSIPIEPAAPADILKDGIHLGETLHRGESVPARLPLDARLKHIHIIGASGTGKSTLLVNLILQDIQAGHGVGVMDPHGDLVDEVLRRYPSVRSDDLILFDPADETHVVGWNILQAHSLAEKEMLSSDLVAVFRRLSTSWGDQMTAVLGNAVLCFLESERGGTLSDLRRFLVDETYREQFLNTVRDPQSVSFWQQEFPLLVGKKPQGPILTRLDTFLRSRLVRDAVTVSDSALDFRAMVDRKSVFLARLSQGAVGEENAALLGALLVSKFHQVSLTRQDQSAESRAPFFLYVDEFQDVATPSMASLFSGARKYRLGVTVAHQDLFQLHTKVPEVERAVLANAYTRICFRVTEDDARRLERGISGFVAQDLMNLKVGEAIGRIGRMEDVFRLRTSRLGPCEQGETNRIELRRRSLERWGRPRVAKSSAPKMEHTPAAPIGASALEAVPPKVSVSPSITAPPPPLPARKLPQEPGRGGEQHKYLQEIIRQWGHDLGFKATVEHVLPEGGRVDVLLSRDGLSVACEIAVNSTIEHELDNLRKCLAADFSYVLAVSQNKTFLKKLEAAAGHQLGNGRDRVRFLTQEEALCFLEQLSIQPSAPRVAGYAIRMRYRPPPQEETQARKRAMTDIIARSLRQMKESKS